MDHSLPFDADPVQPAASAATGRRPDPLEASSKSTLPQFTDDPMLDRLYGVTLALVAELAVTRTRLDTLERVLARREVVSGEEIETFVPDTAEADARGRLQAEYVERVLRALSPQ